VVDAVVRRVLKQAGGRAVVRGRVEKVHHSWKESWTQMVITLFEARLRLCFHDTANGTSSRRPALTASEDNMLEIMTPW
jgi:hypothetical protein